MEDNGSWIAEWSGNLPISCTIHRNTMQSWIDFQSMGQKSHFSHLNAAVANSLKMEGLQVGS